MLTNTDTYPDYHAGAIFTAELGALIENGYDIGLKDYPIFDEEYRGGLNDKIIQHYWFREIGLETPALFKRFLNRKMNEIMPYYNQLYKSALLDLEPYLNYSLETQSNTNDTRKDVHSSSHSESQQSDSTTTSASTSDATARTLDSSTPQMQLAGYEDYATQISDSNNKSSADTTGTQGTTTSTSGNDNDTTDSTGASDYLSKVSGLQGMLQSTALQEYRDTFLNIDMMVVEELGELFMGIYTDYWNGL